MIIARSINQSTLFRSGWAQKIECVARDLVPPGRCRLHPAVCTGRGDPHLHGNSISSRRIPCGQDILINVVIYLYFYTSSRHGKACYQADR